MEPSEYKTGLLEMQKGADALWQRLFDMEKQVGASHSILESIEAMAKDIEAFAREEGLEAHARSIGARFGEVF